MGKTTKKAKVKEGRIRRKKGSKGTTSMRVSVAVLCDVAVILAIVLCMAIALPSFKGQIQSQTQSNLKSMAVAYGKLVNNALGVSGKLTTDKAEGLLGEVKLDKVESSYAYLVSAEGATLYSPIRENLGKPVENSMVTDLVEKIKSGEEPEPDVIKYKENGVDKYGAYYVTKVGSNILVISADVNDVMSPINQFIINILIFGILCAVLMAFLSYLLAGTMTRPLLLLTEVVNKTADFNFENNKNEVNIAKRKDEAGQIGRAIQKMRINLRTIVEEIDVTSVNISENAVTLKEVTNAVNEHSSDNSATAEQLAAGMQETSATTESIHSNIGNIEERASEINQLSVEGANISQEIMERAEKLEITTREAKTQSERIYADVKSKTEIAIEQSKAVNKINELTNAIMAIADQTSLLALNASIEAARAGESGRGFAVVAGEIGNLANQSAQTVNGITAIVNEVHIAVQNMSDCLGKTLDFLETSVANDYNQFSQVSHQYNNDAHVFQKKMNDIHASIDNLTITIKGISEAISGINSTVGEANVGVNDIAEKTSNIVNLTSKTYDMVESSVAYADELKGIVERFQLD